MIPSQVAQDLEDTLIPWMLMRSILFLSGEGKGSSSPRDGCFMCGGAHFQRDCDARERNGKQSFGKGKQSKSCSESEGKGKSKERKRPSKRKSKGSKGVQGSYKGKTSKIGLSGREIPKSETSSETQFPHTCIPLTIPTRTTLGVMMAGVTMNGMMTGVRLDGIEGWDQTCDDSTSFIVTRKF